MSTNPVPKGLTPFTSESAKAVANKRWAASAEERTTKRIEELIRTAPPLTESQKSRLRVLLGGA